MIRPCPECHTVNDVDFYAKPTNAMTVGTFHFRCMKPGCAYAYVAADSGKDEAFRTNSKPSTPNANPRETMTDC
jgi:hypothetical protein